MLVSKMEPEIQIGNRKIGKNYKPLVIAEIGINHEGHFDKAMQMVKDANESGAECVKFQMHIIEDEMIKNDVIPANANESIWDIMVRCSLTLDEHIRLKKCVEDLGMIYLCTPFSRAAANELEKMGVLAYKIGSGECNNFPLIKHISSFGKPTILSTGMNNLESISKSVKILEDAKVSYALMHCTSMYPTPYNKVRLGALKHLRKNFPNVNIGLSDHSIGNYTCLAAIAIGATILEKHFTSDRNWPGPDIQISITPSELKDLIVGSNAIHEALGGEKDILKEEQPTIDFAYSSVVSIKDIKKEDKFTKENIWVKRPGTGEFLAKDYENVLGKTAKNKIKEGNFIRRVDVK